MRAWFTKWFRPAEHRKERLAAAKHLRAETGASLTEAMQALDASSTTEEAITFLRNRGNA